MAAPRPRPEKLPTLEALAHEAGLIHRQIARHAALARALEASDESTISLDDHAWLLGMLAEGLEPLDLRADTLQSALRALTDSPRSLRLVKGRRTKRGGA